MNFDSRTLQKKQRQRITLEIDIFGAEEIDCTQVEKIAESFTNFVRQIWCLSDPSLEFAINSKASVQPPQLKTQDQVQLPCTDGNGRVKQPYAMK